MSKSSGYRLDVLGAAKYGGWDHDQAVYDGGDLVRDLFSCHFGVVRVVWLRTPWSDGRFAGAIFSDKATQKDRNVWQMGTSNGLLALLKSAKKA